MSLGARKRLWGRQRPHSLQLTCENSGDWNLPSLYTILAKWSTKHGYDNQGAA